MYNTYNEFIHFLKKKNVYSKWKREVYRSVYNGSDNLDERVDIIKTQTHMSNMLKASFVWDLTKEGSIFWLNLYYELLLITRKWRVA